MKRHLLNEKFVTIEQLADGGYAHKLPGVTVEYSFAETFLGEMLVASTPKGVCYMAFVTGNRDVSLIEMVSRFPGAHFEERTDEYQRKALAALSADECYS